MIENIFYVPDVGLYCSEECVVADHNGVFPKYNTMCFTYTEALDEIEDLLECSCTNCGISFNRSME